MRFFILAFFIWVLEIIMFASVVFIPLCLHLRGRYIEFGEPFFCADIMNCATRRSK